MQNMNFTTEHDTAKSLMIQTFDSGVKVESNIATGLVRVLNHSGMEVERIYNPNIPEFEQLLIKIGNEC